MTLRRHPAPAFAALAATVLLSGCVGAGLTGGAPATVSVARGAVTVTGPAGYCVDRRLTRDGPDEAFVVLGSCAALSRGGRAPAGTPAVLTATVSPPSGAELPPPSDLEAFLLSDEGRAALSRVGDAGTVEIVETERDDDVLYLYLRDSAAGSEQPGAAPAYWRALFGVEGRLVSATVLAFADRPLSVDQGFAKLAEFVARLRAANSGQRS